MTPIIRIVLILFFTQISFCSYSQDYFANIRTIGMKEGLSHYKVLSFYPEDGGMWIGTEDGLNFYNGHQWKQWTKDDGQLSSRSVKFLQKDQENNLWIFDTKLVNEKNNVLSIDIFEPDAENPSTFRQKFGDKAPFSEVKIKHFFEDENQRLYFFTNDQLWRYTKIEGFEPISLPLGFEPHTVFSDGSFVGKMNKKLVVVSSSGEVTFVSNFPLNDSFYEIKGDHQKFWAWQHIDAGCKSFEKQSDGSYKLATFPIQSNKNQRHFLKYFDKSRNHLWVTKGFDLYLFDSEENQLFKHDIEPRVISVDQSGIVWIGKYEATLLRLEKNRFKNYLNQNIENPVYQCRGIIEKNRKLFVNTYRGPKIIDLDNGKVSSPQDSMGRNFVFLKDQNQHLWLAYRNLIKLDESDSKIAKTYIDQKNLPRIWSLYEDQNRIIWIGRIGLSYLKDGVYSEFEKYNGFDELKKATILFFFKDKNGVIWFGSNVGLYQLDRQKGIIAAFGKKRKGSFYLPSNKFQHMYQDSQGVYWLATEDAGLIRWNKATGDIEQIDKTKGLLSNNIYSVYEDDFGYLWMSSFNGIIRFHKDSKDIVVFNKEDGISDNEFNRISHYQSENGTIYFGSQNGVTSFHPSTFLKEQPNREPFEITIKNITVFGKKILKNTLPNGSKIDLASLDPSARVIDLDLSQSELFWTDKIVFHYVLEELDQTGKTVNTSKDNISSDNHIELFGMTPGKYNLQVKAILKNGKQLGMTLNIPIEIAIPYFHKPGFWGGLVFIIILGIWGFIKLRTAHLRKRHDELEIIVNERAQQILKNQKTILTQAEQIQEMRDQLNRKDEIWLEQFKTIIDERLEDANLGLPSIIDDMDISRSVFYEKVKSLTNMTPNQYIQELRLTKAKAILDKGDVKTVKEVAHSVGINRPSYFSKLFKERFGILPSAYFRDHKN